MEEVEASLQLYDNNFMLMEQSGNFRAEKKAIFVITLWVCSIIGNGKVLKGCNHSKGNTTVYNDYVSINGYLNERDVD